MSTSKKAAGIFLFNSQAKPVLVTIRANDSQFGLPGGKLDDGETFLDAALRETYEETGVQLTADDVYEVFNGMCDEYTMTTFAARFPVDQLPGGPEVGVRALYGTMDDLVNASPYSAYNRQFLDALLTHEDTHPYLKA